MTNTQTTVHFQPAYYDDMNLIESVVSHRADTILLDDETASDTEVAALTRVDSMFVGTQLPRSIWLTDVERVALRNALTAWSDNLLDDEDDGADHHDEIVQLARLIASLAP